MATKKKKLPCDLEEGFLETVKDTVVFLQRGPEPATSIRSFVQDALEDRIKKVKRKYRDKLPEDDDGNPAIPRRKNVRLRQGRPMS